MVRGLVLTIVLSAATASAQSLAQDVNVDVHVDVAVSSTTDDTPAPPPPPAKVPRRYLTVAKLWTIRDGEGYRLDLEVARGSLHHRQSLGWSWIAGVGVSQIDEQTPYYGHADEIQAHDLAAHGFVAWALRLGPIETRCGFAAGLERTSGMQTDWTVSHDVSQIAPMAELYAQASFDIGPVTALFGDRMIVHAERYSTIDGMDWFTREPTLEAYVGIAAPLD